MLNAMSPDMLAKAPLVCRAALNSVPMMFIACVQAEMAESTHRHDAAGTVSLIVKDTRTK